MLKSLLLNKVTPDLLVFRLRFGSGLHVLTALWHGTLSCPLLYQPSWSPRCHSCPSPSQSSFTAPGLPRFFPPFLYRPLIYSSLLPLNLSPGSAHLSPYCLHSALSCLNLSLSRVISSERLPFTQSQVKAEHMLCSSTCPSHCIFLFCLLDAQTPKSETWKSA